MRQGLAIVGCVGALALLTPHASDGRALQATTFKNIKVFDGLTDEQINDAIDLHARLARRAVRTLS